MTRCRATPFSATTSPHSFWRALAAALGTALVLASTPATAQVPSGMGSVRNFPDAALRGELTVNSTADATLNGNAIRMAPGMRLFSPQNTLVMMHTIKGQQFTVNYLIENSTGMLITAWILTKAEAASRARAAIPSQRNYRFESDATPSADPATTAPARCASSRHAPCAPWRAFPFEKSPCPKKSLSKPSAAR